MKDYGKWGGTTTENGWSHPRESGSGWNKRQKEESHFQWSVAVSCTTHASSTPALPGVNAETPDKVRKEPFPDDLCGRTHCITRVDSTI